MLTSYGKFSPCLNNLLLTRPIARASVLAVTEKAITRGSLTITDAEGEYHFGTWTKGCNEVHLRVTSDDFWTRILLWVSILSFVITAY